VILMADRKEFAGKIRKAFQKRDDLSPYHQLKMKILSIDILADVDKQDGLGAIKMKKLGQVVILTGPNGSGKTRILNKIFNRLKFKPSLNDVNAANHQIPRSQENIINYSNFVLQSKIDLEICKTKEERFEINERIQNALANIEEQKNKIFQLEQIVNYTEIETSEISDKYIAVPFVPKNTELVDCSKLSKADIITNSELIEQVGIDHLPSGTFAQIQIIQDRWFHATHPTSSVDNETREDLVNAYEELRGSINLFLGAELNRTINGEASLFGFPLGAARLSNGQKIILQFCLAIYCQGYKLDDLILVMDEPENYLHPSAIIRIINKLCQFTKQGQIWIATHSIALISYFKNDYVWWVNNNNIRHGGKLQEKILASLLVDENAVLRLKDFLNLPATLALNRFAYECLANPLAVDTPANDPQSKQIRDSLLIDKRPIRVLDFGAGKGRLVHNLSDIDLEENCKLFPLLDYIAFDSDPRYCEDCKKSILTAYGSTENRYFNDFNSIFSVFDNGSFDVVVLCNVLHEINPKDWLSIFSPKGNMIHSLLSNEGYLLIVEDYRMPVGEKAHCNGFVLLDTAQIKKLFRIKETDKEFECYTAMDGRLKAHKIPKKFLARISSRSRLESIKSLSAQSREMIKKIRSEEISYSNGNLHSLWAQLFVNSEICLSELV